MPERDGWKETETEVGQQKMREPKGRKEGGKERRMTTQEPEGRDNLSYVMEATEHVLKVVGNSGEARVPKGKGKAPRVHPVAYGMYVARKDSDDKFRMGKIVGPAENAEAWEQEFLVHILSGMPEEKFSQVMGAVMETRNGPAPKRVKGAKPVVRTQPDTKAGLAMYG